MLDDIVLRIVGIVLGLMDRFLFFEICRDWFCIGVGD